ncbi:quinol monooxygenase YgiN [Endobacter medicaginis]|uniref:Antibiotic biosynthesis monooxygenase n=1 Tax=Endobacter medicaginis TaxID=1181271 RepID=A0A839V207_9PROT|nr:putative quinol monooxygenase [Endobacter medicaginis]MBB3173622.1 quinol monooxygenase YgiN [Endobacter medicaginis]MCX5477046.1 putative quinol monooxygenase [Endobacter medicaginis]NVN32210.1 antibiotic biosynthesis monooxygenase [Endobacter medicaginis]
MASLHVIATIIAKDGQQEALREALLPAVHAFRTEDGCEGYSVFEDRDRPGRIMTHEIWRDAAALDAHMNSPTMQSLKPRLPELLAAPFEVIVLDALLTL